MPLVSPEDLRAHLPHEDFDDDVAESAIRLVSGWLLQATGLTSLPHQAPEAPTPDPLWGACLELAGIVIANPEQLAARTVGPTSKQWPQARRIEAILDDVRAHYRGAAAAARAGGSGFGTFRAPEPWPDPPLGHRRRSR